MSDALLSPCGTYRYTLGRNLRSDSQAHKPCLFVMLNPSTADASLDDPTIRRCIGFAERERCTFLTVVNLFAYRATDPASLVKASAARVDIVGPENAEHVGRELRRHNRDLGHLVIAAWGGDPISKLAMETQRRLWDARALCLGMTKSGAPRHPLYLRSDTPLIPWVGA